MGEVLNKVMLPHHKLPLLKINGPPLNFDGEPDHESEDSLFGWREPPPYLEDNGG